ADGGFLAYRPVDPIPAYGALVLHFTTETTPLPPPPTTTTTTTIAVVDATEADAAVAQAFWEPFVGGDADGWVGLLAPDALVIDGDEQFGVSDPLPPGLSIPDWDGDGVVAVLDVIYQQSAFARITRNQVSVACVPAGPEVACTVNETDVFYDAAGTVPPPVVQRLTIEDGLIAEIGAVDVADFEAADAAFGSWASHYGLFEAWVNDTYPDRFDSLFTAPCCVGSPGTLNVVPATVDELAVLLDEWSAGIG
ncbi:MAG: hypothetical protein GY778_15000, partial [bacterium]|nr:hypothetical protein [bacterium]